MSQFGMQMPGGRTRRTASMDVYTGLLFCAVLALGVACGFIYKAAATVAPGGSPFQLHPDKVASNQSLKVGQ
jgi:hypothetical protein